MLANKKRVGLIGQKGSYVDVIINLIEEEFDESEVLVDFFDSDSNLDKVISKGNYDVIFIDADGQDLDSYEVFKQKEAHLYPFIILISSSESLALKAFEVHVFDFLLKPLEEERVRKSLDILKDKLNTYKIIDELINGYSVEKFSHHSNGNNYLNRLLIREGNKMFFVDVDSIEWIKSESNYNRIHTRDDSYLIRGSLKNILKKLDPNKFFRIHRSVIINIEMLKCIEPFFHGDYKVIMRGNKELKMTRNYTDMLSTFKYNG